MWEEVEAENRTKKFKMIFLNYALMIHISKYILTSFFCIPMKNKQKKFFCVCVCQHKLKKNK